MDPVLITNDLSIGYKDRHKTHNILAGDINLAIYPGDFVCLIGPNGCGKSTLLRTLAGMQSPIKGSIKAGGRDLNLSGREELAKIISVVLTENFGIVNTSVRSIISLGRYPYSNWLGTLKESDYEAIDEAIESAGLAGYRDVNFTELSDGIRQKVMIARALAQDTSIILLDEPTAFLDAPSKLEIIHMLRSLARRLGKAVILSSNDLDLVLQSADSVILITKDKKVETDIPENLVLNGHFEEAFNKEDVKFSLQQGIFKMESAGGINFLVKGGKGEVFWTERALARIGISAIQGNKYDGIIEIISGAGKNRWKVSYNNAESEFDSLNEVLAYIRKRTGGR